MQEAIDVTSEISVVISDVLTVIIDSIEVVVISISTQLAIFLQVIGIVVLSSVIELIDDIFWLYPSEWTTAQSSIVTLSNWINRLILDELHKINNVIANFTNLTNTLIENFAEQLALIDNSISPFYNERMFVIYSRIAEFSEALNVPPFYLEGIIQNARLFGMVIACSSGLSYYQFELNWADNLEKLLRDIAVSVALYRKNPQWLKVDIEGDLIRPLFEIEANNRRQEKEQLNYITNKIPDLENLLSECKVGLDENKQAIKNLFILEIAPVLAELRESFNTWKEDIYANDKRLAAKQYAITTIGIQTLFSKIMSVLGLLDYGGDLLLRVNKLSGYLRIEQEDKIADVTTRSYRRLVPEWLSEVKRRVE